MYVFIFTRDIVLLYLRLNIRLQNLIFVKYGGMCVHYVVQDLEM